MRTNEPPMRHASPAIAGAVWHALCWLAFGNALGVMIAILLLLPGLNVWLGEWTYGRWMMVHMNTALYGWCSLPLLAFLFKVYGVDNGPMAKWCRPILWLWSAALAIGTLSWLSGHTSGKLFLDWTGYARVFFAVALAGLWLLLAVSVPREKAAQSVQNGWTGSAARIVGLVLLLCVPVAIYVASSPTVYPAVNPDSGGPTGASQLESSLGVIAILLILPFGLTRAKGALKGAIRNAWLALAAEILLCILLGRADISHHRPMQFLSLGSLLIWVPLLPAYYDAFAWHAATRRWRTALLWWWGGLVVSGWITFLPGVLDRIKFTDALVGHSLTAMAGFVTALLIFAMMQLLGEEDAWVLNRRWSFYAWNLGVLAYVLVMTLAGWAESVQPGFTMVPGQARSVLYVVRLMTGLAMLAGSVEWLIASSSLPSLAQSGEAILCEKRAA